MPDRVQRSRKKGARLPPNTLYCGRPTRYGNPFRVVQVGKVWQAVWDGDWWLKAWSSKSPFVPANLMSGLDDLGLRQVDSTKPQANQSAAMRYEILLDANPMIRDAMLVECRRHEHLACWCPLDAPCHVDILLYYLLKEPSCTT